MEPQPTTLFSCAALGSSLRSPVEVFSLHSGIKRPRGGISSAESFFVLNPSKASLMILTAPICLECCNIALLVKLQ